MWFQPSISVFKSRLRRLLAGICLVTSIQALPAQVPPKPVVVNTTPKYVILVVVAYEVDKARAAELQQKHDLSKDASEVMRQMESAVKAKSAARASCMATAVRSGSAVTYENNTASLYVEGIISATAEKFHASLRYQHKGGGVSSLVRTVMDTRGGHVFLGSVPDTKPGKDQLVFARCLIHFLK